MLERTMRKELNKKRFWLIKDNIEIKYVQVETGTTKVGIPDLYFYTLGSYRAQGWIELKQLSRLKRKKDITIPYRPGQLQFLIDHAKSNKRTFLLLYVYGYYHLINNNFKKVYLDYKELLKACVWIAPIINEEGLNHLIRRVKK